MTASINAANFLMLSTFGIAAVGYLLGRITIKGISLGTAGVFVIALVYGAFFGTRFNSRFVIEEINYASQALKIIENLGLVFFVTSVGFIAGPNFFKNMKHNFKSYVLLGVVIILSGGLTAILCLLVGRAIESGQPGYDPGQLTAMISGLQAYLSGKTIRPMTDKLTVKAPEEVTYSINLTYYINRSDSARAVAIQAAVAQAVEEYKTWQRTIGRDVNPSQLAAMVMEAGAKRVTVTAPTFAAVAATKVAALTGSATVTYGGLEDD